MSKALYFAALIYLPIALQADFTDFVKREELCDKVFYILDSGEKVKSIVSVKELHPYEYMITYTGKEPPQWYIDNQYFIESHY